MVETFEYPEETQFQIDARVVVKAPQARLILSNFDVRVVEKRRRHASFLVIFRCAKISNTQN